MENDWNHLARAEALTEIERWREAIHELHKLLSFAPENYRALCLLGQCHYQLGEHEDAVKWASKAIASAPNDEWSHRLKACAYRKLNNKKEALASAEEAVRIAPQEPYALHILACVYIDYNRLKEAETLGEKLREISPETRYGHSSLGHVFMNRRKWSEAETHFRKVLEIDPLSWDAMNNLGWVLLQQSKNGWQFGLRKQKRADAIECFRSAIQLDPTEELSKTNLKAAEASSYIWVSPHDNINFGWLWLIIPIAALFRIVPMLFREIGFMIKNFTPAMWLLVIVGMAFLIGCALVYSFWVKRRLKQQN